MSSSTRTLVPIIDNHNNSNNNYYYYNTLRHRHHHHQHQHRSSDDDSYCDCSGPSWSKNAAAAPVAAAAAAATPAAWRVDREDRSFTDFTIAVRNGDAPGRDADTYRVHRVFLVYGTKPCAYFRSLLLQGCFAERNGVEITLRDDAVRAFPYFLDYIYTGTITACSDGQGQDQDATSFPETKAALIHLGNYFGVQDLVDEMERQLRNDLTPSSLHEYLPSFAKFRNEMETLSELSKYMAVDAILMNNINNDSSYHDSNNNNNNSNNNKRLADLAKAMDFSFLESVIMLCNDLISSRNDVMSLVGDRNTNSTNSTWMNTNPSIVVAEYLKAHRSQLSIEEMQLVTSEEWIPVIAPDVALYFLDVQSEISNHESNNNSDNDTSADNTGTSTGSKDEDGAPSLTAKAKVKASSLQKRCFTALFSAGDIGRSTGQMNYTQELSVFHKIPGNQLAELLVHQLYKFQTTSPATILGTTTSTTTAAVGGFDTRNTLQTNVLPEHHIQCHSIDPELCGYYKFYPAGFKGYPFDFYRMKGTTPDGEPTDYYIYKRNNGGGGSSSLCQQQWEFSHRKTTERTMHVLYTAKADPAAIMSSFSLGMALSSSSSPSDRNSRSALPPAWGWYAYRHRHGHHASSAPGGDSDSGRGSSERPPIFLQYRIGELDVEE